MLPQMQARPLGGMFMLPPGAGAMAPQQAAGAATMQQRTLGNKKRKAADFKLPDRVSHMVPESEMLMELLESEARVDRLIKRRKDAIYEALLLPDHVRKILRLYVTNSHAHQPPAPAPVPGAPPRADAPTSAAAAARDNATADPASWTLTIWGQLHDREPEALAALGLPAGPHHPPASGQAQTARLTSLLQRVEVQLLDEEAYPGELGHMVWDRALHLESNATGRDAIEFRRLGSRNVKARLTLWLACHVDRLALAPKLSALLGGVTFDSRPKVLQRLWMYVKSNNLNGSDPGVAHIVKCNAALQNVFGVAQFEMKDLPDMLTPLLSPISPTVVEHEIRVDAPYAAILQHHSQCVDLDVHAPDKKTGMDPFFDRLAPKEKEAAAMGDKVGSLVNAINERRRRRAMLLGFARSPVEFIDCLVASQGKEVRNPLPPSTGFDTERRTDVFKQPWAEEAAVSYLAKKTGGGALAPGAPAVLPGRALPLQQALIAPGGIAALMPGAMGGMQMQMGPVQLAQARLQQQHQTQAQLQAQMAAARAGGMAVLGAPQQAFGQMQQSLPPM